MPNVARRTTRPVRTTRTTQEPTEPLQIQLSYLSRSKQMLFGIVGGFAIGYFASNSVVTKFAAVGSGVGIFSLQLIPYNWRVITPSVAVERNSLSIREQVRRLLGSEWLDEEGTLSIRRTHNRALFVLMANLMNHTSLAFAFASGMLIGIGMVGINARYISYIFQKISN